MSKGLKERVDREIHNFIIHEFLQNKPFMGVDHFVRNLLDTRSELSTVIITLIEQEKDKIENELAGHKYALSALNAEIGLPRDNTYYSDIAKHFEQEKVKAQESLLAEIIEYGINNAGYDYPFEAKVDELQNQHAGE